MKDILSVDEKFIKQIIREEMSVLDEYDRYKRAMVRESARLRQLDVSQDIINEELMAIAARIGGGFLDVFKTDIVMWFIRKLNIDPRGTVAHVLANVVEETPIFGIKEFFKEGGCVRLADTVIKGVIESIVEPVLNRLASSTGGISDVDGKVYRGARETLTNTMMDSEVITGIREKIISVTCGIEVDEIVDVFKGSVGTYQENPGTPIGMAGTSA